MPHKRFLHLLILPDRNDNGRSLRPIHISGFFTQLVRLASDHFTLEARSARRKTMGLDSLRTLVTLRVQFPLPSCTTLPHSPRSQILFFLIPSQNNPLRVYSAITYLGASSNLGRCRARPCSPLNTRWPGPRVRSIDMHTTHGAIVINGLPEASLMTVEIGARYLSKWADEKRAMARTEGSMPLWLILPVDRITSSRRDVVRHYFDVGHSFAVFYFQYLSYNLLIPDPRHLTPTEVEWRNYGVVHVVEEGD